ncbi:MAG: FGGY-family carbohydrate kinase [Candidatus Limnocylindrales bacterium]
MTAADRVLALDVGTQSVRAMVFDPAGNLLARTKVPIEPYVPGPPGCCEQDADLYWRALGEATRALWQQPGVERASVAGVALTTQRGTVVPTDESGEPLRRAMVWLDRCRAEGLPRIGGSWGLKFKAARATETVATFQAEAEANVLARGEPEMWARVRRYLLLSGFLVHRLTGRFADSVAAQVGYLPFDHRGLRWADDGDWKWLAVPVRREWLPELVPPGSVIGRITTAAAEATGIPAGLPLVAAAGDKACEVLGSGALEPHIGAISLGTTATFNTTHRRYLEVIPLVPPYPAAVPGTFSLEVQVYRGFWMIEWFKREFGAAEVARARELGVDTESLFDELVLATPPGSMGLVLQPYWSPGVRIPGPEAKGAVIGWGDVHTRAHLYRAILEGLAYALREGMERTGRRTKAPVTEIRVSGGGSQSPAAVQLVADVFGLPAKRPHTHETSGLGAAIDAAVGLGLHPSFEAAVAAMTRTAETRDPDPAAHAVYEELYRTVYLRLYAQLQPLYREIRRITGYPPEV